MGSVASKTWSEVNDFYYKTSSPQTHNRSVKARHESDALKGALDPRSPTLDFDRTPIQVTDYYDDRHVVSSDEISAEARRIMESSDPRSPSLGVNRTPIDLVTNDSISVQLSAMRLSFETTITDMSNASIDSLSAEDKRQLKTPSREDKDERSGGQRVRTPLSSVPQKQTPNRNVIRNRKQLEITKRAHINSHLLKNKTIVANGDNTLSPQVIDDKENL